MSGAEDQPTISVVVPLFNEEAVLEELVGRLIAALDPLGLTYELLLVDDGSTDRTAALAGELRARHPVVRLLALSRNFGHQPAVTAGLQHARGDVVVLMDGDLQDPPEVVPELIARWREGFDIVLAERERRARETWLRDLGFRAFYPLLALVSGSTVERAGIFSLMDRRVVLELARFSEQHRYLPGLRDWVGFRKTKVPYQREARGGGEPKQSLPRLIAYAADALVSFSTRPLRIATWLGVLTTGLAFGITVFFVIKRLFFNDPAVTGFTTLLTMICFLGGVQLITIGILGEYVGRIYTEVKARPFFVVDDRRSLGFGEPDAPAGVPALAPAPAPASVGAAPPAQPEGGGDAEDQAG